MQVLKNVVLSAPTSFLVLASLRQAVRLACLAAASPESARGGGAVAGAGVVVGLGLAAGVWVEAGVEVASHAAAATVAKYMDLSLMEARIASPHGCTDEARMKLA
jgi:hypothetical protein